MTLPKRPIMLPVVVLDMHTGKIEKRGTSDGVVYDQTYLKVFVEGREPDYAFAAACFPPEHAERISNDLQLLRAEVKQAEDRYSKAMYTACNEYKFLRGTKL